MRDKQNDEARLHLMLESIANIKEFMAKAPTYEAFATNKVLCHAVIYNIQCVGEGVYMLSKEYRESHPTMDWDAIACFRHVLVHDYYQVSLKKVWQILMMDLPALQSFLQSEVKDS